MHFWNGASTEHQFRQGNSGGIMSCGHLKQVTPGSGIEGQQNAALLVFGAEIGQQ
jgi:hypothetical protein